MASNENSRTERLQITATKKELEIIKIISEIAKIKKTTLSHIFLKSKLIDLLLAWKIYDKNYFAEEIKNMEKRNNAQPFNDVLDLFYNSNKVKGGDEK